MMSKPGGRDFAVAKQRSWFSAQLLPLWLALPIYLAYALLTPPFQTPDEPQHLFRAWQLSDLQLIGERREGEAGGLLPTGLGQAALKELGTLAPHTPERVLAPPRTSWLPDSTPVDASRPVFLNFLGAAIYSPAGYVPQVAAIWIGRGTGLSVESIVFGGRVLNLCLFLFLMGVAIRLTPWGRPAFLFVTFLPTTVSATSNFGQDGVVIGLSAILVAGGLRVVLLRRWSPSSIATATFSAAGLALTKWVYLPLLFAAAWPGRTSRNAVVEHFRNLGGISVLSLLLCAGWLSLANGVRVAPMHDVGAIDVRLASFLADPTPFFVALQNSFGKYGLILLDGAFTFGWLNVGPVIVGFFFSLAALVCMLLAGGEGRQAPGPAQRGWFMLVGAGTVILMCLALWLYYTPPEFDRLRGLQTRYLLPVALLVLAALLPSRCWWSRGTFWMINLLVIANVVCLFTIVSAYYAF